jgi:hypothetical protein
VYRVLASNGGITPAARRRSPVAIALRRLDLPPLKRYAWEDEKDEDEDQDKEK